MSASDYFNACLEHRVALCKLCCYAVWPDQAQSHLSDRHPDLNAQERAAVVADLRTWPGLATSTDLTFALPAAIDTPITGLPVFSDGLQCQLQPGTCHFICRSEKGIKKHWRTSHQWSLAEGRRDGAFTVSKRLDLATRQLSAQRPVHCQRLFHHGTYARYFEVHIAGCRANYLEGQEEGGSSVSVRVRAQDVLAAAVQRDLNALEQEQEQQQGQDSQQPLRPAGHTEAAFSTVREFGHSLTV